MQTAGEPSLQALGKVPNSLCQCSRDGAKNLRHQKIHDALVENVVTCVEVIYDGLATGQKKEFVSGKLLVRLVIDRDVAFTEGSQRYC